MPRFSFPGRWAHERKPGREPDQAFTVIATGSPDRVRVRFDTYSAGHQEVDGHVSADDVLSFIRPHPDGGAPIYYSGFGFDPGSSTGRDGRIEGFAQESRLISDRKSQSGKCLEKRDDDWTANRPA